MHAVVGSIRVLSVNMVDTQKKSKYACTEPNPESLCSAANTCGSATTPCTVQIKKDGQGATVTPSIPDAKKNKVFCVKTGTKMNFEAKSKNTGFVVDFDPSSPFEKKTRSSAEVPNLTLPLPKMRVATSTRLARAFQEPSTECAARKLRRWLLRSDTVFS